MGTSYTVVAGLGVIVDLARLEAPEVKKPSCDHPERIGQTFCPACGKRVGEYTARGEHSPADDLTEFFWEQTLELPDDYICSKVGYEDNKWFIGFGDTFDPREGNGVSFNFVETPTVGAIKEAIGLFLKSLQAEIDGLPDDLFDGEIAFHATTWIN